ncbi:winged helix-turn-helix transcriptional regulator (plasmid) [Paenibacillus cellulosilyticus]|uniref:MarR family winged helix-turn-helix transcriptional regulator n=1 Tax=Paenibacillus cellulosilyticus TaxID=375489 RepID=UPI00158059B9|nr:MarR family winged helix-turn-helix transcriptional regulator [Paenibacillus cellulosilyticus]QKS48073.1 winged helix-turn-helix transcriptional regulator [Paenibacillus cellulosilyticus]
MDEHQQLSRELMNAFRQLRQLNWTGLRSNDGLTKAEIMTLFHIRHATRQEPAGPKASELARSLNVTMPTVTQTVNVLEARGLLERHRDPADRRAVRIRLTTEGEAVMSRNHAIMLNKIGSVVEHLGAERSRELIEILQEVFRFYSTDPASICPPPQENK